MPANLENSAVATGLEKVSFHSNAKECSNYCTIALISHTSKVMLKILQGRLQQYVNHELPDVQAGFRKGRGTRDQIANIRWIIEKARWLSGEALQIAVKRREAKSKGEKERYKHLNTEFQRIARRDKKAFFSNQCKEIEENNRMGKTRDIFKKIRDTKGAFHAKMGSIKDRNGMHLTETEDIKKRWQEYTEELYKKELHDQDNMMV